MADRMLMMTWGTVARGMETRALDAFNDALGILGRRQQAGQLESFDVGLLAPNGDMDGYMIVKGSAQQIMDLRESDEFRRNTIEAQLCVDDMRHIEGVCDEGVAASMAMFVEAIEAVPATS